MVEFNYNFTKVRCSVVLLNVKMKIQRFKVLSENYLMFTILFIVWLYMSTRKCSESHFGTQKIKELKISRFIGVVLQKSLYYNAITKLGNKEPLRK